MTLTHGLTKKTTMKNFKSIATILFTLLTLFTFLSVNGQEDRYSVDGFSINPKLGFYNPGGDDAGFNGGVELNVLKNKFIYSADFYRFDEFVILGPEPSEFYNQIGLMIGKYIGDELFRFQYQAGLASFWGLKRTDLISQGLFGDKYNSEKFFTIGLTTKLGFKIVPLKFLSIGIDLETNINLENIVFTPMLSIEIGKLRNGINEP
jgi:hypothetical protein